MDETIETHINTDTKANGERELTPAWHIVLINLLIWILICSVGAAGNYQDSLHDNPAKAASISFLKLWLGWVNVHVPLFILSTTLYLLLNRYANWISNAQKIIRLYLSLIVFFYPLHILYISLPRWYTSHPEHTLRSLIEHISRLDNFTWFLEFAWFTGAFAVTIAIKIWHLGQERILLLQQTQQANLHLKLALEQQRLRSIRQQLEPHFIFNALNAISALVRSNEKPIALQGINTLSELLRYALKASSNDFVRFSDEIRFIQDYLALQSLRYEDRLSYNMIGLSDEIKRGDCPPLLLQPIVENALRHDLDCHDQKGEISLEFWLNGKTLTICIINSRGTLEAYNPGLGLGLSQTEERLRMIYADQASLTIEPGDHFFKVMIQVPLVFQGLTL
mgnify:FL=1